MAAWRAIAANLFDAGADGVYVFNGFFASQDIWREIGEPETLAGKDKIFGVDQFTGDTSFKGVREQELQPGEGVSVHFQVGEDVKSGNVSELRFRLHLWDLTDKDDMSVKLNGAVLSDLAPEGRLQAAPAQHWLACRLQAGQVRRGENQVEIILNKRDESVPTPLILDGIQLFVAHENP